MLNNLCTKFIFIFCILGSNPKLIKMTTCSDLESIIKHIAGTWYNPVTKATYRFTPLLNGNTSKIYLKQDGKSTVEVGYRIVKEETEIWLELDSRKYKISNFIFEPEPLLSFITPGNQVIVLFKDSSKK